MKIYSLISVITFCSIFNFVSGQAPGSLDLSFNGQGYRIDTLGNRDDKYNDIISLPDGNFLICGSAANSSSLYPYFRLHKVDANGNQVGSFNQTIVGVFPTSDGGSEASVMTLNANGQIIIGGTNWINGHYTSVSRHNADGSLDETFSPGGYIAGSVSHNLVALSGGSGLQIGTISPTPLDIKTDASGNIFYCGKFIAYNPNVSNGYSDKGLVVKYTNTGILDSSFSFNGVYDFNVNPIAYPITELNDIENSASQIEVLNDGKILVLGSFYDLDINSPNGFLARLNSDGTLDQTFATNGILLIGGCDNYGGTTPERMLVEEDGSIVIVGNELMPLLCKVLSNGMLDISFGNNGYKYVSFLTNDFSIKMFEKTENGKYIITTQDNILRFNSDFSIDYTFRNYSNQEQSLPLNTYEYFNSGTITTFGEVLMVGEITTSSQFTNSLIARINGSECTLAPIVQPSDVYGILGSSVTISLSIPNAIKYTWQVQTPSSTCLGSPYYWYTLGNFAPYTGSATSELTISNLTQALDGKIYRCIIQTNDCGGLSEEITLHIGEEPSVLERITGNRISASPNPARDYIRISSNTNQELNETFQIVDLNGKIVQTGRITGISQEMNLSFLAKGLYRIQLENGGGLNFVHE